MPNMLEDGADFLVAQLQSYASISITYRRGASSVDGISAIPGSSILRVTDSEVERVIHTDRDYFFAEADLPYGMPVKGDRIVDEDGYTYEILPIDGSHVWKQEDQYGRLIQVHTKRVKV